jgi:hypothetical protein
MYRAKAAGTLRSKCIKEWVVGCKMNLLDASIEVSLAQGYQPMEFAASGGVLNPKRE